LDDISFGDIDDIGQPQCQKYKKKKKKKSLVTLWLVNVTKYNVTKYNVTQVLPQNINMKEKIVIKIIKK